VAGLAADGTTVFLTTQYLEEADRLAGRIAVLDGGRIVAQGTAAQLKATVGGFRLELVAGDLESFECLRARLGNRIRTLDPAARTLGVPIEDDAGLIRRLLDSLDPEGALVRRFTLHSASLDDAFLALTGHTPKETTRD
jgi:ABC-2 type transport system ATP-binding protein